MAGGKSRLIGTQLGRPVVLHRRVEGAAVGSEDFLDALCVRAMSAMAPVCAAEGPHDLHGEGTVAQPGHHIAQGFEV